MLFNSFEFALFLTAVLALVLWMPHRAQNRLLLVASYLFYGLWDWRFLGLIGVSTLVDYTVARSLERSVDPRARRLLLAASVATNLGILAVFKYAGFFVESLAGSLALFGVELAPLTLDVILPVGISFYTFQTMSYTIDVYRRRMAAVRSLPDFALFVAFFPQLVAGPIERASHLLPQIQSPRRVDMGTLSAGGWLVFWGLFKKTVIADNLAVLVDIVYAQDASPAPAEVLLATWAFALQIYCDFSGYTDIARGSARMLGFDLIRNFDLPYLATSVADFWRRWHISLSTWLRDYLYIPLGGNRKGSRRTELNLMLTMVLGGLWHGAAWNFVLWGAYHGVLLVVHRGLRPWLDRVRPANRVGRVTWHVIRVFFVFQAVSLGWLLFRAENAAHIASLLGVLAGPWSAGRAIGWLLPFAALATPLVLIQALQALTRDSEPLQRVPWLTRTASYSVLLCAWVVLGNDGGQPFIYFQF